MRESGCTPIGNRCRDGEQLGVTINSFVESIGKRAFDLLGGDASRHSAERSWSLVWGFAVRFADAAAAATAATAALSDKGWDSRTSSKRPQISDFSVCVHGGEQTLRLNDFSPLSIGGQLSTGVICPRVQ